MLIKKSPPKRLPAPASSLRNILRRLQALTSDAELFVALSQLTEWQLPKADLFHFIPVLNRIDKLLNSIILKHFVSCKMEINDEQIVSSSPAAGSTSTQFISAGRVDADPLSSTKSNQKSRESADELEENVEIDLSRLQQTPFAAETKFGILAILNFTRLLLENSTNRSIYNSYEHLNVLLNTLDLDVLEATLRLLHRPAHRSNAQKSPRFTTLIKSNRILPFIEAWGPKDAGFQMSRFLSESNIAISSILYKFYRLKKDEGSSAADLISQNTEGLVIIPIHLHLSGYKSDADILNDLVAKFSVPVEHHLSLFQHIRLASAVANENLRLKLLRIRLLAITLYVYVANEATMNSQLLAKHPELISEIADVLQAEKQPIQCVLTVCFYALEAFVHRGKLTDTLNALNGAANHGILMFIIRQIVVNLDSDNVIYTAELVDAILSLISTLITSQNGGNTIVSAGIMPILVQMLENRRQAQMRVVSRVLTILDSILYGFHQSFEAFIEANGLDIIVTRIEEELGRILSCVKAEDENLVSPISPRAVSSIPSDSIPFEFIALFKSLLRFLLHVMQSSSTSDRVRNLIEGSLPESLKAVVERNKMFGGAIYALVINLMATFIHNEPSSFTVLNEKKLPDAFLTAIISDVPVSSDVLSAIPFALGAICLNAGGLSKVRELKPFKSLIRVFYRDEHMRSLLDEDVATFLGHATDELIRHHPDLKTDIMEAVKELVEEILKIGNSFIESVSTEELNKLPLSLHYGNDDDQTVEVKMVGADTKPDESKEISVLNYIDGMARFLEGLFQNPAPCKEFMENGGKELLLKIYRLPCLPYDFASSTPSYSISHIFRIMTDIESPVVLNMILKELDSSFDECVELLNYKESNSMLAQYIDIKDSKRLDAMRMFRGLVICHCYIGLLCDVYSSPLFSHSKTSQSIVQIFSEPLGMKVLERVAHLYRVCGIESLYLKNSVPKAWITSKSSKSKGNANVASDSLIADPNDRRIKNTRYIRYLLSQTTSFIVPTLQGLSKILLPRRADPSQRKSALQIADVISNSLIKHISWSRFPSQSGIPKYHYIQICAGLIQTTVCDERNQNMLLTIVAASFVQLNGIENLFDLLKILTEDRGVLVDRRKSGEKFSEKNIELDTLEEMISRTSSALETILKTLLLFVTSKALHDSSHTAVMTGKDRFMLDARQQSSNYEAFDPFDFMVECRFRVLLNLQQILSRNTAEKWSAEAVRLSLQILSNILKSDGETVTNPSPSAAGSSQRNIVPSEDSMQTLINMGFSQENSISALQRFNNDIVRATEFLSQTSRETGASSALSVPNSTNDANEPATVRNTQTWATFANNTVSENAISEDGNESFEDVDVDSSDTNGEEQSDNNNVEDSDLIDDDSRPPTFIQTLLRRAAARGQRSRKKLTADEMIKAEQIRQEKAKRSLQLSELRSSLKESVVALCMDILDAVPEEVFSVKDVFAQLLGSDFLDMNKLLDQLSLPVIADIWDNNPKRVNSIVQLWALLCQDSDIQPKIITSSITNIESTLLFWLKSIHNQFLVEINGAEDNLVKDVQWKFEWIASFMLVIEAYLTQLDQILAEKAEYPNAVEAKEEKMLPFRPPELSSEQLIAILTQSLEIIRCYKLNEKFLHGAYRIIVLLTRRPALALDLIKLGGLQVVLNRNLDKRFRGQSALSMLILRHLIESDCVLQALFEREIISWFLNPRERSVDVQTFLKNFAPAIARNSKVFMAATKNVCRLKRADSLISRQQYHITLIEIESSDGSEKTMEGESANPSLLSSFKKSLNSSLVGSEIVEDIVQFLFSELLSIRHSFNSVDSSESSLPQPSDIESFAKTTSHAAIDQASHYRRCFILQTLAELFESYPPCKLALLKKSERESGCKSSKHVLLHILNEIIPYPAITTPRAEFALNSQLSLNESHWALHLLTLLACPDVFEETKNERERRLSLTSIQSAYKPEYGAVRRLLLECISRSIKDAISCSCTLEKKYGRYQALADLTSKILSCKASGINANIGNFAVDPVIPVCKIMMERQYIPMLSGMLNELDLNYPDVRHLANSIIRPIELLAKIANKIGKSSTSTPGTPKESRSFSSLLEDLASGSPSPIISAQDNYPNESFIRNSALGMFSPGHHREDRDSEMEDSENEDMLEDFMEESDDMDDAEEFTDMSEDSAGSDEESGNESGDDMEIAVRTMPPQYDSDDNDSDHDSSNEDNDDEMSGSESAGDDADTGSWTTEESIHYDHDDLHGEEAIIIEDFGSEEETDDDDDDRESSDDDHGGLVALDVIAGNVENEEAENEEEEEEDDDDEVNDVMHGEEFFEYEHIDDFDHDDDNDHGMIVIGDHRGRRGNNQFGMGGHRRVGRRTRIPNFLRSGNNFDMEINLSDMISQPVLLDNVVNSGFGQGSLFTALPTLNDSVSMHPMLQRSTATATGAVQDNGVAAVGTAIRINGIGPEIRPDSMDSMVASNALQLLEQIFRSDQRESFAQINNHGRISTVLPPGSTEAQRAMETSQADMVTAFHPVRTVERWWQESRLIFGAGTNEQAQRLLNSVLNLLVPAALAAEEKRKEKERLLKEEKEAAKQREEEEAKKAEEARQKEEHRATKEAQMEIETAPTENVNISSSLAPASSTVVTVHGTNIDLANTGIDPTFLEALPDDLRAEVLAQHLREQRMISSNSFPSEISEEFMQALPEDIREELVRQEMVDRMQRERPARDIEIPFLNDRSGVATGPLGGGSRPGSAKKRPAADGSVIQKEPPQLIDRLALLPFIRMLFVSQPLGKSYLQQLFIHLCENAKTREDLISLLLSIVQECCNSEGFNPSQSAISKGKSSKTQQSHRRSSAAASAGLLKNIIGSAAFALGSPELFCTAVQRCLATCLELVTADENVAKFFLSEVDVDRLALLPSPAGSGNTVSTKTKRSKIYSDQPPRTTYPLVVLLSLLEKPIFLLNTQLMDQITQLIAAVSRPLLSITEKLVTAPVAEVSASSQPFA